jgi:hypothetical protein
MQGGPVDELLDVAVERPALDQLEVEVGRTLEDRAQSGLTGDHRQERHLDAVDQSSPSPSAVPGASPSTKYFCAQPGSPETGVRPGSAAPIGGNHLTVDRVMRTCYLSISLLTCRNA